MDRRNFGQLLASAALGHSILGNAAFALPPAPATSPGVRYSVMLWTLAKRASTDQGIDIIAAAGFNGVEMTDEWQKWTAEDKKRILAKMSAAGLTFDAMTPGTRIALSDADEGKGMAQKLAPGIEAANSLGCSLFIFTPGMRAPGIAVEAQFKNIVDNLKRIADVLTPEKINIVLEPIDLLENKGSAVTSVADGFDIVRQVGSPHVKVLYDFYHEQRGAGNIIDKIESNIDLIGLCHVADVPGRHHPGTGEMNYSNIFKKLASLNYNRYIAMEFMPIGDPVAELTAARMLAVNAFKSASGDDSQRGAMK